MMNNYQFGTNQALENLWLQFSTHPQGHWIMKMDMISKLCSLVQQYKPAQILDLGTGIGASAACMSAVSDNTHILSVEQNEKLVALAQELIPHDLKQKISFHYSPATAVKPIPSIDPFRYWSCYVDIPWSEYNFIVIDGPGPFILKDSLADLPNGDIIWMLSKMTPGTKIFLQGRLDTRKLYKRFLGWYLDVTEESNDYCLFERSKEQLNEDLSNFKNSDITRGFLIERGYFQ